MHALWYGVLKDSIDLTLFTSLIINTLRTEL